MFGITECKRVTIAEPDVDLERPGSVGTALPGTTVQIVDDDGVPVAPGGERRDRGPVGPHVMAGYWRSPELTRAGRFAAIPAPDRPVCTPATTGGSTPTGTSTSTVGATTRSSAVAFG